MPSKDQDHDARPIARLLLGAIAGLAVGLVVAVNVVIFAGVGDGYETGITAIFDENVAVGVVVVALWALSPFVGAYVAWRQTR